MILAAYRIKWSRYMHNGNPSAISFHSSYGNAVKCIHNYLYGGEAPMINNLVVFGCDPSHPVLVEITEETLNGILEKEKQNEVFWE